MKCTLLLIVVEIESNIAEEIRLYHTFDTIKHNVSWQKSLCYEIYGLLFRSVYKTRIFQIHEHTKRNNKRKVDTHTHEEREIHNACSSLRGDAIVLLCSQKRKYDH